MRDDLGLGLEPAHARELEAERVRQRSDGGEGAAIAEPVAQRAFNGLEPERAERFERRHERPSAAEAVRIGRARAWAHGHELVGVDVDNLRARARAERRRERLPACCRLSPNRTVAAARPRHGRACA